ncbi:hypothetical protein D3C76_193900 [compost metagenome]
MRVTIFSQDLKSGKGVVRLARCLQRDWPGAKPIGLCTAQNLMSRCLGYSDYYDVRMSADDSKFEVATLEDLRAQSFEIIKAEVQQTTSTDGMALEQLSNSIAKWPFHNLGIFKVLCAPSSLPFSARSIHDPMKMSMYYMIGRPENFGHQAIIENVQASLEHFPINSSERYLPTSFGICPNDLTPSNFEGLIGSAKCLTCGPFIFKKPSSQS